MPRVLLALLAVFVVLAQPFRAGAAAFEKDLIRTSAGELEITFIGHGTLMLRFGGKVFHVDPWTKLTDYAKFPKADAVLVTHEHFDHLDLAALEALRKDDTVVVLPAKSAEKVRAGTVMGNGDSRTVLDVRVEAVPAYNIAHKRDNGQPFHPRGEGNGYILNFGDTRVYIAGDTENTPEMKALRNIDVAFLPMNLPYTMTPEMVADAAKAIRPKVLYPYHFGETETARVAGLLKGDGDIEVRIRRMP